MRAVVQTRYGSPDVLELREIAVPEPAAQQVLMRVRASSVNSVEYYRVGGPVFARFSDGLRRPKSPGLGVDAAGVVEAVGGEVHDLRVGDEVFGLAPAAWAEHAVAREDRLALKPAGVPFEDAAAAPVAALTALQALRDHGRLEPGQKVLVNGASGGVGTYAVQLAKELGGDVTAACSTPNVETVRELGADRVVDYRREDFTRLGVRHELMLDIAGSRPFRQFRRTLTPDATVVLVGGPMNRGLGPLPHLGATIVSGKLRSRRVTFFVSKANTEDLAYLGELLASGRLRSVIDRTYALADVREALRYFGQGHARGKVVLTV